jgi:hypothetical protein
MKLKQALAMPIGMILLAIAIIMGKFLPHNNIFDFVVGILTGLSIVLNLYYIFIISQKSKEK